MKLHRLSLLLTALLLCACSVNDTPQLASRAAEGDPAACYEYGHRLLTGHMVKENKTQAVEWLKRAADKGNIRAAAALGACYTHALGTKPDSTLARKWYTVAAEAGHPHAQIGLAEHYLKVDPKDPAQAVTYIRYAAMQGSADAAFLMSLFFAQGIGVPAHQGIALGWLTNAAELGHKQALAILRDLADAQQKG